MRVHSTFAAMATCLAALDGCSSPSSAADRADSARRDKPCPLIAGIVLAHQPASFQGGFPSLHEAQQARDEADYQSAVTVYDAATRSEIKTAQDKAALRSLFELKELGAAKSVDLYFGPKAPPGQERRWIQTTPGKGWFSYFRIYGPEQAAFDGTWKPADFEEVR